VIGGTKSQIRSTNFSSGLSQTIERLRRRYFVNEMEIDVEK
jgi:hypothetical protein